MHNLIPKAWFISDSLVESQFINLHHTLDPSNPNLSFAAELRPRVCPPWEIGRLAGRGRSCVHGLADCLHILPLRQDYLRQFHQPPRVWRCKCFCVSICFYKHLGIVWQCPGCQENQWQFPVAISGFSELPLGVFLPERRPAGHRRFLQRAWCTQWYQFNVYRSEMSGETWKESSHSNLLQSSRCKFQHTLPKHTEHP